MCGAWPSETINIVPASLFSAVFSYRLAGTYLHCDGSVSHLVPSTFPFVVVVVVAVVLARQWG